jgi:hypothetical protein
MEGLYLGLGAAASAANEHGRQDAKRMARCDGGKERRVRAVSRVIDFKQQARGGLGVVPLLPTVIIPGVWNGSPPEPYRDTQLGSLR